MIIKFKVYNQILQKDYTSHIISDSQKYLYFAFEFSDDWNGASKFVQMTRDDDFYELQLDSTNQVQVPWELLVGGGKINIALFGSKTGGILITTNSISVNIEQTGIVEDEESLVPTENAATAILNQVTAKANIATTKAAEASASATSASTSASTATQKAVIATSKASEASASASSASTSASNAATSEANALSYKNSASTSASTATTKASEASASATSASQSATTAGTKATEASNSATAAANSATSASTSASTATTKANAASTSATNAKTSETNAANSATTATQKYNDTLTLYNSVVTKKNEVDAIAESLKPKYLNALDYGVSTSLSDNTAKFSLAIKAAVQNKLPLYIPAGTYKGSIKLHLDEIFTNYTTDVQRNINIDIYGDGMATIIQGASGANVFSVMGATKDENTASGSVSTIRACRFFKIHDMQLVGANNSTRAATGLYIRDVQNFDVYNIEIRYCLKGMDFLAAMDGNFHNINILDVGTNDTLTGADYAITMSNFAQVSRACNALKFNNIRIENYNKILSIGDANYGIFFNNFKIESGRTISGVSGYPISIAKAKGVFFNNGHIVYSNSHVNGNISSPTNVSVDDNKPYIYISDFPVEQYNFATGDRISFNQVNFGCPPGWKAQFIDACRTVFNSCTFNSCDGSSSTQPAIKLRGNSILSNCYVNNSNGDYIIGKTSSDIISNIIGSASSVADVVSEKVSKAGDTMTGDLKTSASIVKASDNSSLFIGGGTKYGKGAFLVLYGSDHSTNPSRAQLSACSDGGVTKSIVIDIDGTTQCPTPATTDNSTKIATTAFVKNASVRRWDITYTTETSKPWKAIASVFTNMPAGFAICGHIANGAQFDYYGSKASGSYGTFIVHGYNNGAVYHVYMANGTWYYQQITCSSATSFEL